MQRTEEGKVGGRKWGQMEIQQKERYENKNQMCDSEQQRSHRSKQLH